MKFKAKDILAQQRPITLGSNDTLYDARNMMIRYNVSRIVIVKKDENKKSSSPVGVITEKDIARFLYEEASHRHLKEIRLDEVMSVNLITANDEDDLTYCARLMLDNEISSIIIVTGDDLKTQTGNIGNLLGIITKSDLVGAYPEIESGNKNVVSDYMTEKVFTVDQEEVLHIVLMLMTNNGISRVVVVKNNKPIGIVTTHDLLPVSSLFGPEVYGRFWTTQEKEISRKKVQKFIPAGIKNAFLVSDVMTADPICVSAGLALNEAAYVMARNRISGIPAIDSQEKLAGIITKTDIVRSIADMAQMQS